MEVRTVEENLENDNTFRNYSKRRRKAYHLKGKRCLCYSPRSDHIEFLQIWEEFRRTNQFCDGIVRCDDGVEFNIHRAILSAVSPYFKAVFTNTLGRGQNECRESYINVSSDIFKILLDFAYTGKCEINHLNVEKLLIHSDQYGILGAMQLCCKFLMDETTPQNCLSILQLAEEYFCKSLVERCRLYVKQHFMEIVNLSSEFVYVPFYELLSLLRDDSLNVSSEKMLFDAINLWVNFRHTQRRNCLLDLLKCIRWGHLPYECVSEMASCKMIKNDKNCKAYLSDIMLLPSEISDSDIDLEDNYIYRPRTPCEILFAVGGWSEGSPTTFIETYDIRADRWLLSIYTDIFPKAYHGLCTLRGLIYIIGGFDGNDYYNTVRSFDPITHTWSECACMYYIRCYVSVVVLNDKIYAMGGYDGRLRLRTVERYDPDKKQWELIAPMIKERSDASAAVLGDKIYIAGGFNGLEVLKSAEVYNVATNQWFSVREMSFGRSGVCLVSFRNSLYAIGGFNGQIRLNSCEKFTPGVSYNWEPVCGMNTARSNFATAILEGYIYVIGGFNDQAPVSATINFVEYYDCELNEWFDGPLMNLTRSALGACVIKGLPNAREYSYLGRYHRPDSANSEN